MDLGLPKNFRFFEKQFRISVCTAHTISADNVEALILSSVKRLSRFVLNDEKVFAWELQSLWSEKQEAKPKHNQSELQRCQKRYDKLSTLIRGLYENLMSGLLPERQYKQLMKQYDDEQAELEAKMETMEKELSEEKDSTLDIKYFISLIRKCKNPTEISDLMFAELIDKIVVYEAEGVGKARTQKVDIYFNYVGQVDISYTEEELAEIKAQEEQEEKKRLEKQRKREKTYREKRKAKKIAENGGKIIKKKICSHCGKEFTPTSNRQIFCTKECCNQERLEKQKAEREAERGNHYYRQRKCAVCGRDYWPTYSQQQFCSDGCKRTNHNKKTLEFYYKKKEKEKQQCKDSLQMKEAALNTSLSEITTTLALKAEEIPELSKYGRLRAKYLREHRKILYFNLLVSGKLGEHLAEIDTSACDMAEYLIKEMAKRQGVTEKLKAEDMMRWRGLMNNIRACVDDIVYS